MALVPAMVVRSCPAIYMIVLTFGLQILIETTIYDVGYLSGGTLRR